MVDPARRSSVKTVTFASRVVATLFLSVFLAMGLFFECMTVKQARRDLAPFHWTQTEATIIESAVVSPTNDGRDPMLRLRYAYNFHGESRSADRYSLTTPTLRDDSIYEQAARYAVGRQIPCWVNPEAPGEAVLVRASPASFVLVLFPLIFVLIGGGGIWFLWSRRSADDTAPEKPISSFPKSAAPNRVVLILFFSLFLAVGLGVTYALFVRPLLNIAEAAGWTEVPCEVVSSRVRSHSDSDGTTYSADIVYRYLYQGRSYTSNRYRFMRGSSSGYEGKAAIVRRLPPGTEKVCYVNPRDPSASVMERGFTADMWFGLLPIVFALVGGGGLYFTLKKKPPARSPVAMPAFAAPASDPVTLPLLVADASLPATLKPIASRKMKLIATSLGAVFWNGIVSIFVFNLFSDGWGAASWFLALFLLPFVAIGLGLIGGAFYYSVALFNPICVLNVSRSVAHPGETIEVSWLLSGRTDIVRRFKLTFEGREEATYRRGTHSQTDKETFTVIPLVDTSDPIVFTAGSEKLHIPQGAMHSFASANNKIVWIFRLKGEIPRWPDIDEEYAFTVAPFPLKK